MLVVSLSWVFSDELGNKCWFEEWVWEGDLLLLLIVSEVMREWDADEDGSDDMEDVEIGK